MLRMFRYWNHDSLFVRKTLNARGISWSNSSNENNANMKHTKKIGELQKLTLWATISALLCFTHCFIPIAMD